MSNDKPRLPPPVPSPRPQVWQAPASAAPETPTAVPTPPVPAAPHATPPPVPFGPPGYGPPAYGPSSMPPPLAPAYPPNATPAPLTQQGAFIPPSISPMTKPSRDDLAQTTVYSGAERTPIADVSTVYGDYQDIHEMGTMFGGPESGNRTVLLSDEGSPQSVRGGAPISGQPVHGEPLPPDAPEWMRLGRVISSTIENAIRQGDAGLPMRAAMSRAWAAWQLGGYSAKQVAQVARLVDTTYRALRETGRQDRDEVLRDCATIIHNGMPRDMRTWMPPDRILAVVEELLLVDDPKEARMKGTARLLGWTDAARAWAAEAVSIALGEER